jgi:hypothetical protein
MPPNVAGNSARHGRDMGATLFCPDTFAMLIHMPGSWVRHSFVPETGIMNRDPAIAAGCQWSIARSLEGCAMLPMTT